MNCFPMMLPMEGRLAVLVGGGAIALRKAEKMAAFGMQLTVCAREILPPLAALAGTCVREYSPAVLDGAALAVAATDDAVMNARVAADCRARGVPVNSVDAPADCDFYFPALIVRGGVTVAISTGGASPALAAALRRYIEGCLPRDLEEICRRAAELRGTLPPQEYAARIETMLAEAER